MDARDRYATAFFRARAAWAAWAAGPPPRPFGRSLSGAAVGRWGRAAYRRAVAAEQLATDAAAQAQPGTT